MHLKYTIPINIIVPGLEMPIQLLKKQCNSTPSNHVGMCRLFDRETGPRSRIIGTQARQPLAQATIAEGWDVCGEDG